MRNPSLPTKYFFGLLISLWFSICTVLAQEYCWPTDASQLMTSSFGEYRSGHFHAGMDIKTWGLEGYKVFAIGGGSVIRVRVSPYGYGRAVYLLLDNGITVVYAHLSRFSDRLESFTKEEQKRKERFAVEKVFKPGFLQVEKGDLVGYTGSSGNGAPHLHFEVRDTLNRPFNPLFLGFPFKDTILPTLEAVAATPLFYGSHIDGDYQPKVFPLHRVQRGIYILDGVIRGWGKIGLSLSAYDRANGAANKFAPYLIRLFVDGEVVFTNRYDSLSFSRTGQVELDRDYRLNNWGMGLFQRLFRDIGNELTLYEPAEKEAGMLSCWEGEERRVETDEFFPEGLEETEGSVAVGPGRHGFRIEATDFFGNSSEVTGVFEMIPLPNILKETVTHMFKLEEGSPIEGGVPNVEVEKYFFDETIRFCIRSYQPLPMIPTLVMEINSWDHTLVPLHPKNELEFVGWIPWKQRGDASMMMEVRYVLPSGLEGVIRDTLQVFEITPDRGGSIVSPDGLCRVIFPRQSVYRTILGSCRPMFSSHTGGAMDWEYNFVPQDVPLKGRVNVLMNIPSWKGEKEKLGVYVSKENGGWAYVGNTWKDGAISAWTGSLNRFTVLEDTVAPNIFFIQPGPDSHIRDRTPRITVGFKDTLSGIYGEENYRIRLDNTRLIVEYDPMQDLGFHRIEEPLAPGRHTIELMIRDIAGNTAVRRSAFFIDPEQ